MGCPKGGFVARQLLPLVPVSRDGDSYGYWSVGVHYSLSPQRRYSCD